MGKYIVKRVLLAIISILIVSAITFFVMNIIPGGPFNKEKATSAEAQKVLEERYNLDKPIPEQYVIYMNNLLHGDWGVSLHSGRDIWGEISSRFKVSAKLGGMAALVAIVAGLVLGSIAALTRNRWPDRLIVFFTTLGTAMPSFVLATLLLLVFCLKLGWFPVWSSTSPNYVLPIIALSVYPMAYITRLTKTSMLGFPEPGLHPYGESKRCSGLESHFQTCTAQCADSGNHLRGTDGCIHFDRFHGC